MTYRLRFVKRAAKQFQALPEQAKQRIQPKNDWIFPIGNDLIR